MKIFISKHLLATHDIPSPLYPVLQTQLEVKFGVMTIHSAL